MACTNRKIMQYKSYGMDYIENTNYTEEEIRANIKTDWYVRGQELVDRNLVNDWVTDIDELL